MAATVPGKFEKTSYTVTTTVAQELIDIIVPFLTTFETEGTNTRAWELVDTLDSTDVVLRSIGDPNANNGLGDARIWVRLYTPAGDARLSVAIYQDWSTDSSTGSTIVTGSTQNLQPPGSGTTNLWMGCNEYECFIVYENAGSEDSIYFGQALQQGIPLNQRGIAFATETVSGVSPVTVTVDHDVTGTLTVGQECWIASQTDLGDALVTPSLQLTTIDSINGNQIGLNVTDISVNSIIGLDPQPCFIGEFEPGGTFNLLTSMNGVTADTVSRGITYSSVYGTYNPHAGTGFGCVAPVYIGSVGVADAVNRGTCRLLYAASDADNPMTASPYNSMTNDEFIRVNYNDEWKFWVFPDLGITASRVTAAGPLGPGF